MFFGEPPGGADADIHRWAHFQQESARVLHAPSDIGHGKARGGRNLPLLGLHVENKGRLMIHAVNTEQAMHLNLRSTLDGKFPVHPVGHKYNFRIAVALKNVLVHPRIPGGAAARAALRVHHNRATRLTGIQVEMNYSTFQPEGAVYCMQDIPESEIYRGARRVERDGLLARRGGRRGATQ